MAREQQIINFYVLLEIFEVYVEELIEDGVLRQDDKRAVKRLLSHFTGKRKQVLSSIKNEGELNSSRYCHVIEDTATVVEFLSSAPMIQIKLLSHCIDYISTDKLIDNKYNVSLSHIIENYIRPEVLLNLRKTLVHTTDEMFDGFTFIYDNDTCTILTVTNNIFNLSTDNRVFHVNVDSIDTSILANLNNHLVSKIDKK